MGDLSSDLNLAILSTPSVKGVEGRSPGNDSHRKPRSRARPSDVTEEDQSSAGGAGAPHRPAGVKSMPQLPSNPPQPCRETDPSQLSESYVSLLGQLAASVEFSTQAVVCGELTRLEERTAAQQLLWQKISALLPCFDHHANPDGPAAAEVLAAQWRLLHRGRVQHALLQRAQQNLRAASNQLAGPHSGYAPIPGEEGVELRPVGMEE